MKKFKYYSGAMLELSKRLEEYEQDIAKAVLAGEPNQIVPEVNADYPNLPTLILLLSFDWDATPQGHAFWADIYVQLLEKSH